MSDTATTPGGDPGHDLKAKADEARASIRERVKQATEELRDAAGDTARQAEAAAEKRKNEFGESVHDLARALHKALDELHPGSVNHRLLSQAADGLDDLAGGLENRSLGEMVGEVSEFGRRNPTAFIGGAALAGFALSRFATASAATASRDAPAAPPAWAGPSAAAASHGPPATATPPRPSEAPQSPTKAPAMATPAKPDSASKGGPS